MLAGWPVAVPPGNPGPGRRRHLVRWSDHRAGAALRERRPAAGATVRRPGAGAGRRLCADRVASGRGARIPITARTVGRRRSRS